MSGPCALETVGELKRQRAGAGWKRDVPGRFSVVEVNVLLARRDGRASATASGLISRSWWPMFSGTRPAGTAFTLTPSAPKIT